MYQLSTPMDIKDFDDPEKRLLLAVLYQLADDEGISVTDEQRAYIRSVKRYLEIANPQTDIDLSAVENIDSIDVQKAFLQVVLEFFYLQEGDELSDAQEEFLSYFSVNKKQAELIEIRVSRLYNSMGAIGLAEKYGYVPEKLEESTVSEPNAAEEVGNIEDPNVASDVPDSIADMIFKILGTNTKYVETENYFVYEKLSGSPYLLDVLKKPEGIYAISKKTGEQSCLLSPSSYPNQCCSRLDHWVSIIDSDDIYAFFSETVGANSASVYTINAATGELVATNIKADPSNVATGNREFFIHSENFGKLVCVDFIKKQQFRLLHEDHNTNDRVCTTKALYFTDYKSSKKQLVEYSFDNHSEQKLAMLPHQYGTEAMSHYDETVFMLLGTDYGYCLGYVDLKTREYVQIENAISLVENSIRKHPDGWLFLRKDKDFEIEFFDFNAKKVIALAQDCGYKEWEEGSIFSKGSWRRVANQFIRIGDWVYYQKGKKKLDTKVHINRPMEYEPISEPI